MPVADTYTIGSVVKKLSSAYPDLTVSKVRFLEAEGLVSPHRTKNGYRRYTEKDIDRLETVLRLQSKYFYPLAVIKERLEARDRGEEVPELAEISSYNKEANPLENVDGLITLEEAHVKLDVPIPFIRLLADHGLITIETNQAGRPCYNGIDTKLIVAAYELQKYGIDPRFLRLYVQRANRELPIFKSTISSGLARMSNADEQQVKKRFNTELENLIRLTSTVSESIIRREVRDEFGY
ncbi:MAG: MerR family transcriptional regulator [Coriobacteriales bacterium]|nr:MerR family transcriptional regulator [Coriobacteriales bacterium]